MLDTVMHWLGFGLCHQLPDRSFFAGAHQFPVCARDTGLYLGFVASLVVVAALDRGRHRTGRPHWPVAALGMLSLVAMVLDGATSYLGFRTTTNELRFLTGFAAGYALPLVVFPLLSSQLWRSRSSGRVLASRVEQSAWTLGLPAMGVVLLTGVPALGWAHLALTAISIVVTFTAVNLVVVLLVPVFERRATRIIDAWPAIAIAVLLTAVELAAAGCLRLALLSIASRV